MWSILATHHGAHSAGPDCKSFLNHGRMKKADVMLTHSFCWFDGLSAEAERVLWRAGFMNWRQLVAADPPFSNRKCSRLRSRIPEMEAALEGGLVDYFLQRLPVGYRLRAWPAFAQDTAFLDIETTGLDSSAEITVIGLYYQGRWTQFVQGVDLHRLLVLWNHIRLLISFNGQRFDIPMIRQRFGIEYAPPHIDLMQEAKVFGYAGGLKNVEKQMGIRRSNETITGNNAAELWTDRNNAESLQRLLDYNRDDVLNLRRIARIILQRSLDGHGVEVPSLADL